MNYQTQKGPILQPFAPILLLIFPILHPTPGPFLHCAYASPDLTQSLSPLLQTWFVVVQIQITWSIDKDQSLEALCLDLWKIPSLLEVCTLLTLLDKVLKMTKMLQGNQQDHCEQLPDSLPDKFYKSVYLEDIVVSTE